MELHPLAAGFAAVADSYERGRPGHPPAVIDALIAGLGLEPGDAVADLGAGTGKLTGALLAGGLDVVGIEPLAAMRKRLAERVGAERARSGSAEAIPLADRSQRAVTVADAFHWFDGAAALAEIARVLAPGGGLALLATMPDWSGASWGHELGALISAARPEHPFFDGPTWEQALTAAGGWTEPREIVVKVEMPADPDAIPDYLLSMSWIATMAAEERAAIAARAERIVAAGETPPALPINFRIAFSERVAEVPDAV